MTSTQPHSKALKIAAIVAILFGLLTIFSGGVAIFGGPVSRAVLGNIVLFVLWFNFLAGFAYVFAGAGLLRQHRWAVWLSLAIAVSTLLLFSIFGLYVLQDGVFEMRTVGAMTLRSIVWLTIAAIGIKNIGLK